MWAVQVNCADISETVTRELKSDSATTQNKLAARKRPTQPRSLRTFDRILAAARELLKQQCRGELQRVTTNHIAAEAGVSVGSLYQYFPNTEAVLFEIYSGLIDGAQGILEAFDTPEQLALPPEQFISAFVDAMTIVEPDHELVIAIQQTVRSYPALVEVDKRHAQRIARRTREFLRRLGSKWPDDKLERLGLFAYYLDSGTWGYREHMAPDAAEVLEWERRTLKALLMSCLDS